MLSLKRIILVILLVFSLWAFGTLGYMIIEGWSFRDAFFMTAITVSTVGYGEVRPLSPTGEYFTVILIALGASTFFYAISLFIDAFIQGHLMGFFERTKMEKAISRLEDHFIICGYGRIGRTIASTLAQKNVKLVVIERSPTTIKEIKENKEGKEGKLLCIEGDATRDEILIKAGVKRARGIVCVLKSDADNVYITISARWLNPDLLIVARASTPMAEKKMRQAGADRVISPYEIGAMRMALAILQPTVTEFLDLAVHSSDFDLSIEQIEIKKETSLCNMSIKDSGLRPQFGITVLAIQDPKNRLILSPDPEFILQNGHVIVALGPTEGINRLKSIMG